MNIKTWGNLPPSRRGWCGAKLASARQSINGQLAGRGLPILVYSWIGRRQCCLGFAGLLASLLLHFSSVTEKMIICDAINCPPQNGRMEENFGRKKKSLFFPPQISAPAQEPTLIVRLCLILTRYLRYILLFQDFLRSQEPLSCKNTKFRLED